MNTTVPYDSNTSELIMKIGGAVMGVGGPPATLEHDGVKHPLGSLSEIDGIVKTVGNSTSDWTVSSDYTAPVAIKSDESEK